MELAIPFLVSQGLMLLAMCSDFLSLQFKERKPIYFTLVISAILVSAHYFLLGKITAGIIVCFSALRFVTCYFTTNKKYLIGFLVINTMVLFVTYIEIYDFIIYAGLFIFIIGNFQNNKKLMRKQMMVGTSLMIVYNSLIFSPMGIIAESNFLLSNIIGYYRHYVKKSSKENKFIQE